MSRAAHGGGTLLNRRTFAALLHFLSTFATVCSLEEVIKASKDDKTPRITIVQIVGDKSDADTDSTPNSRDTFNALALLLLPVLCFVGLVGNAFVCVAIATDRRLQNVTNYFLFSLALADLLVCCIVMPLSIVVEVNHGVWTWGFYVCLIYVYADVFLCSASIVHMSVISLDRYLGISQPLKTRNKSQTAILIKITLVWLITVLISSPLAVAAIRDPTNVLQGDQCMVHNRSYMIYGSTLSFLIPFLIMVITYVRTTSLLNKQATAICQSGSERGGGLRRAAPPRKNGYMSAALSGGASSSLSTATATRKGSGSGGSGKASTISYSTTGVSHSNAPIKLSFKTSPDQEDEDPSKPSTTHRWKSRTSNYFSTLVSRVSHRASYQGTNSDLMNEHKATRVLAVVFVCFFICWTPFFVANFVTAFCGEPCSPPAWLGSLFLWLGYVSSTINPLIYTIFNKRFRQSFIRILRGQCFHPYRTSASSHISRTHTILPDAFTYSNLERAMSRDEADGPIYRASTRGLGANGRSVAFDSRCYRHSSDEWSPPTQSSNVTNRNKISTSTRASSVGNCDNSSYLPSFSCEPTEDEDEDPTTPIVENMDERALIFQPFSLSVTNTTTTSSSSSICPSERACQEDNCARDGTSSGIDSMRRSTTNSFLETPTRCIPTADLISARPLLLYHQAMFGVPVGADRALNGLRVRTLASETTLAKQHRSLRESSSTLAETDASSDEDNEESILLFKGTKASTATNGPHLTLVNANKRGELYKETFL